MTAVPRQRTDTHAEQLTLFVVERIGEARRTEELTGATHGDHDAADLTGQRPGQTATIDQASGLSSPTLGRVSTAPLSDEYCSVPVALIEATRNVQGREPRPTLLHSISTLGLIQPLVVEWQTGGYRLVAGRARLAVVRALAWADVPCHVYPPLSQELRALLPLTENVIRQPLTGDDRVAHYRALLDAMGSTRRATAALAVHRVPFFRSMRQVRRDAVDLREASLPRTAVAVLDQLQKVAAALDATQKQMLASRLRRVLAALSSTTESAEREE